MNKLNWKSDLSGMKFHLLTVVSKDRQDKKGSYWLCECECGNTKIIRYDALLNGRTKSCGCLSKIGKNKGSYRHGLHNSKIYSTYYGMRQRCENKNSSDYSYYGGRGITVCEEWKIFENFYKWSLENGYEENLTIDRIDNNKGYSPDNCRWVTRLTQQNNIRRNVILNYQGKEMTLSEAERIYGINKRTLYNRYKSGWSVERIITTPLQTKFINTRFR